MPFTSLLVQWGPMVGAWTAVLFAWRNSRTARKNLRLAELQEQRRQPNLVGHLADGYCKTRNGRRLFAFSVSVSNPTDINNSIVQVELAISYTTTQNMCMVMKVAHNDKVATELDPEFSALELPVRIDAHQSIAGWVLFEVSDQLICDCRVDLYTILFEDSHRQSTRLQHALIREVIDEKEHSEHSNPRSV